jgi:hypothetical protein
MQISDLFDTHLRDEAVRVLSDEDLLVAAVMITQKNVTDSLQREWLALDVAWFASHADTEAAVAAIARQGRKVLSSSTLFGAFLRVTHYRDPYAMDDRCRRRDSFSDKIAHAVSQPAGPSFLAELCRADARTLSVNFAADARLFNALLPQLSDVSELEPVLASEQLSQFDELVAHLWYLGARNCVIDAAFDLNDTKASRQARQTAARFLKGLGIITAQDAAAR